MVTTLSEKCPNTEFVSGPYYTVFKLNTKIYCINSVFSTNTRKCRQEKTQTYCISSGLILKCKPVRCEPASCEPNNFWVVSCELSNLWVVSSDSTSLWVESYEFINVRVVSHVSLHINLVPTPPFYYKRKVKNF